MLLQKLNIVPMIGRLDDSGLPQKLFETHQPELVLQWAAQAGVRHLINVFGAYFQANLLGNVESLESEWTHAPKIICSKHRLALCH